MTTVLAVVAAVWLVLVAAVWVGQRRLIYLPQRGVPAPPADVEVVTAETSDGIAHRLWVVPAEGSAVARVLVFNGNAGHKAHRLPLARDLAAVGMEVVLFDYRGYGDTEGSPSEDGLGRDAAAVADTEFDTELPVVYFGESLGGGVATALAVERPPALLVLRSPFPSLAAMARTHYPFLPARLLLRDRFDTGTAVAEVDAPVLVILGTADSIVPPRMSRQVYEAARPPKDLLVLEGLDHNDAGLTSGPGIAEAVRAFFDRVR